MPCLHVPPFLLGRAVISLLLKTYWLCLLSFLAVKAYNIEKFFPPLSFLPLASGANSTLILMDDAMFTRGNFIQFMLEVISCLPKNV